MPSLEAHLRASLYGKVHSNVGQAHTTAQLLLEESWAQSCSWGFIKNKKTKPRDLGWGDAESLDTVAPAWVRVAHTAQFRKSTYQTSVGELQLLLN